MILSSVVLNLPMSLSKAFFSSLLCFWFTVYPLDCFLQFPPPLSWNLPSVLVCYPSFHKILKHINHSYFKYSLWQSQHLSHLWSLFLLISSPVNLLLLVVVLVMVVMFFHFGLVLLFFWSQKFWFNTEHHLQGNRERKRHAFSSVNLEEWVNTIKPSWISVPLLPWLPSVHHMITFSASQIASNFSLFGGGGGTGGNGEDGLTEVFSQWHYTIPRFRYSLWTST